MRRSFLVAALWASTALTPAPAQAGPLVAFVQGAAAFLAGAGGIGFATGALGSAAFGYGFAAAQFLTGTFAGRLLLNVGLTYAINRLTRQPRPEPQSAYANFAQPISYAQSVYGRVRVGGPLGFTGFASGDDVVTGTSGPKRHYTPILAMHRILGVVEHYLADKLVEIDGDGLVITGPVDGWYRIRPFRGLPGQAVDAELDARFPEITSAHDFVGLAGAHIWCRRPPEDRISTVLEGGRQATWAPVIDGRDDVYDPRDTTNKHTRTAALIIADVATRIWGREVDWSEVEEEADACDELVPIRGGGTRPRWQIDIVMTDDQDYEEQRSALAAACDAWFYERADGKIGFKVGRWIEPDITLTDADFLTLEKTTGQAGADAVNRLAVRYTEPANGWKASSTADVVLDPAGNDERLDPQIYAITEHNQAYRMALRMLKVTRPTSTWRGTVGLVGHWLRSRRFWRIEHSVLGSAYVEIQQMERSADGMSFDFEAVEVTEADFDPDVSADEPERPVYKVVASDDTIPDLAGLAGVAIDGGAIRYTWTDPGDDSLTQRIRIRKSGDTDWQIVDVPSGQTGMDIPGLAPLTDYEAQAVNRTSARRQSDTWQPITPLLTTTGGAAGDSDFGLEWFS